jgi:hypothetical protein
MQQGQALYKEYLDKVCGDDGVWRYERDIFVCGCHSDDDDEFGEDMKDYECRSQLYLHEKRKERMEAQNLLLTNPTGAVRNSQDDDDDDSNMDEDSSDSCWKRKYEEQAGLLDQLKRQHKNLKRMLDKRDETVALMKKHAAEAEIAGEVKRKQIDMKIRELEMELEEEEEEQDAHFDAEKEMGTCNLFLKTARVYIHTGAWEPTLACLKAMCRQCGYMLPYQITFDGVCTNSRYKQFISEDGFVIPGVVNGSELSERDLRLLNAKIKRLVVLSMLHAFGTCQRGKEFTALIDYIMKYDTTQQVVAGILGIGLPASTKKSHDTVKILDFERDLGNWMAKIMGIHDKVASFFSVIFADDFTRHWCKTYYGNADERKQSLVWTNVGQLTTPLPAVIDKDQYLVSKRKEVGLLIDETLNFVGYCGDVTRGVINKVIDRAPSLFPDAKASMKLLPKPAQAANTTTTIPQPPPQLLPTSSFDPAAVLAGLRNDSPVGGASADMSSIPHLNHPHFLSKEAYRARMNITEYSGGYQFAGMKNYTHLKTLPQGYKKYDEFARSIMTQMEAPHQLASLRRGEVKVRPADYPGHQYEFNIINQGVIQSPEKLSALFREADPSLFEKLKSTALADGVDAGDVDKEIGKAALNIQQEVGPLHIKLNPPKDIFRAWYDILFNPVFFDATGGCMAINPPLREILHHCECAFAGYMMIRDWLLDLLLPDCHKRADIAAYLWLFEVSLATCMVNYDAFFRNNVMDMYYCLLSFSAMEAYLKARKNYKFVILLKIENMIFLFKHHRGLFNNLCRSNFVDEKWIEQANAIINNGIKGERGRDDDRALEKITLLWSNKMHEAQQPSQLQRLVPKYDRAYSCGRPMGDMIALYSKRICKLALLMRECPAPYRLPRGRIYCAAFLPSLPTRKELMRVKKINKANQKNKRLSAANVTPSPPDNTNHPGFLLSQIGSSAWAQTWRRGLRSFAPDAAESRGKCGMKDCAGELTEYAASFCGHSICLNCYSRTNNCSSCRHVVQVGQTKLMKHSQEMMRSHIITTVRQDVPEEEPEGDREDSEDAEEPDEDDDDDDDDDDAGIDLTSDADDKPLLGRPQAVSGLSPKDILNVDMITKLKREIQEYLKRD